MIFANNNKKIVRKLSKESLKKNRMRNIFAIVAIVLVCLLFTCLFTVSFSVVESMEYQTMRMVGTVAHCGLKYITYEEYEMVQDHPLVKDCGLRIVISSAVNEAFNKRTGIQMQYSDAKSAEWSFVYPTTGTMPSKINEAVMDTKTLDNLGMPHEVGQIATIEYEINEKLYTSDFVVTGFFESNDAAAYDVGFVLVSKAFADKVLEGIDINESRKMFPYTGAHFTEIMLSNSNNIEDKINRIMVETIGENEYVRTAVNWGYMSTNFGDIDIQTIIMAVSIIGTILSCGYFIINNIFKISVVTDIRYYGLLKAVGTTSKQIKSMVRLQMIKLCIYGVPIGLVFGYLVGVVLFPIVIETFTIPIGTVSYNPLIVVFASLFTVLTVYISTAKPCKIAGKVFPIEAVRYNAEIKMKKGRRKSKSGKIYKMAWRNIFKNKSKTISVIASISLSLVVLMMVNAFVSSFDVKQFVGSMSPMDFSVGANQYYSYNLMGDFTPVSKQMVEGINNEFDIADGEYIYFTEYHGSMSEEMEQEFRQWIDDDLESGRLRQSDVQYLSYFFDNDCVQVMTYGVDKLAMETLEIIHGEVTEEMWATGKYVIGNAFLHEAGDTVLVEGDKGEKEYIVAGTIYTDSRLSDSLGVGYGSWYTICYYLPTDEFAQLYSAEPMKYAFNVEDSKMKDIDDYIHNYTNNINPEMDYASKLKYVEEFEEYIKMFNTVGYLLSAIVAFVGICNFVNSILTGIVVRRREFACMESVGMVKKQLYRMLMYEGFYYALLAIGVTLVIGQPLVYYAMNVFGSNMWFFDVSVSYIGIIGIIPILLAAAALLPAAAYRGYDKLSIVDRLRIVT